MGTSISKEARFIKGIQEELRDRYTEVKKKNKEAIFIKGIQKELRDRNIEVKKKDLLKFLLFVHEVCP